MIAPAAEKLGKKTFIPQLPFADPACPPAAQVAVKRKIRRMNQRVVQVTDGDCFKFHFMIEFIASCILYKRFQTLRMIKFLKASQRQKAVAQCAVMVKSVFADFQHLSGGTEANLLAAVAWKEMFTVRLKIHIAVQKRDMPVPAEIAAVFNQSKNIGRPPCQHNRFAAPFAETADRLHEPQAAF